MIVIFSNRKGPSHLSVIVDGKPSAKLILPGSSNIIDDPKWEAEILKDPDFNGWCTNKTLDVGGGRKDVLYTLQTFKKEEADKEAGDSPYAPIPKKKFKEIINEMTNLADLQNIVDKDSRPEVQAAARKRIEFINKPVAKTEGTE